MSSLSSHNRSGLFRSFWKVTLLVAVTLHAATPVWSAAKAPGWLSALAAQPPAMEYGSAKYAVLLDEVVVELDRRGVITHRARYAVRVLTPEGSSAAVARLPYETSSDKVKSFQAWLVPKTGETRTYTRNTATDLARYGNARELYGESRMLLLSGAAHAGPGAVFGYEAVHTDRSIFAQLMWRFQKNAPVETSRYSLTLPEGWDVTPRIFGTADVDATTAGRTRTWQLRRLPALDDEPLSPPEHSFASWLALDLQSPEGDKSVFRQTFSSWADVSTYFSARYNAAAAFSPAMKAEADKIVAGAGTPWERIARLCRYAQNANYISINLNLGEAGGMTPREATRVFQCNYGDCKDKSTLLRALLATQGIESFPLVVFAGDSTRVKANWISPLQFNHCVLAVRIDETIANPASFTDPVLGRFFVFDPTDEHTPPGFIPGSIADSHGLILNDAAGALIRVPAIDPLRNKLERNVVVRLERDGSVSGKIEERFAGSASREPRRSHAGKSNSDFRLTIERWLGQTLPSVRAEKVEVVDDFDGGLFSLNAEFYAGAYGKMMRDTLLVFKPVLVNRRGNVELKKKTRTLPIVFAATSFSERAEIAIPAGFRVDEPFTPVALSAPFGEYRAQAEHLEDRVIFTRTLKLRSLTLPAADYEIARVFFEKILRAEQTPIVLKRL